MLKKLAGLWSVNDRVPCLISAIVVLTFGCTRHGLTKGTQTTTRRALDLAESHRGAGVPVLFGVFSFFPSCPTVEERIKARIFKNSVFIGEVGNTIEEAEKARNSFFSGQFNKHGSIVVVTDEWHSRSAKLVWERVWRHDFPRPNIRIIAVPSSETISADNPVIALRNQWVWAIENVLRHLFLVCVPGSISIMKKLNIHQPVG